MVVYILLFLLPKFSFAQIGDSSYSISNEVSLDTTDVDIQEYTTDEDEYVVPSSPVLHSKFISADTIAKWRNSKEYEQLKNLDSLLRKIQAKEDSEVKKEEKTVSWIAQLLQSPFFKNIIWIIAGVVVLFILYQLIISKGVFINRKLKKNIAEQTDDGGDEVPWENLLNLIQQAIEGKNYRAATRYLFLDTLKLLGDKGLVSIQQEKTNSQYRQELPQYLRNNFSRLALYYEYIWYGNSAIDSNQFTELQSRFSQFKYSVR